MTDTSQNITIEKSTIKEIIVWWEKKRVIYNIVIIGFTIFVNFSFWDYPMRSIIGDNQIIINAILFIFGANLFYTLSWGARSFQSFIA